MSKRRIVTGRRLAVAVTLLVIGVLAVPVGILHLGPNAPPPPQAYRNAKDAAVSLLWPLWLAGITPCTVREGAPPHSVIVHAPTDQCFKMQPQRRFSGIWLDEFEGSVFLEGVTEPSEALRRLQQIDRSHGPTGEWLHMSVPPSALDPVLRRTLEQSPTARLIYLEFDGRRTAYRGAYGHMGMSKSEVAVDRVISARPVHISRFGYIACETPAHRQMCE